MAGAKSATDLSRSSDTKANLLNRVLAWEIYDERGDRDESCCAQLAKLDVLAATSARIDLFNGESEVDKWELQSGCRKVEISDSTRWQLYCFGGGQNAASAFGRVLNSLMANML